MSDDSASPDISARRRTAELLRQFAAGRLTNDQFEDAIPHSRDRAVREMFLFAWGFYDDLFEHRLRGRRRLSPEQRRVFARCCLFLHSGLPYQWPRRAKWLWCPQQRRRDPRDPWWKPDETVLETMPFFRKRLHAMALRLEAARERRLERRVRIDDRIWPFRRMTDYKAALTRPFYLTGEAGGSPAGAS